MQVTHRARRLAALATTLLLLGSTLVGPAASASTPTVVQLDPNAKIHPLLQYGSQADPSKLVRVVVQKTKNDISASTLTAPISGASIVEQYQYIPAFVLTLPQTGVPQLAASPYVRYISPDGAVQVLPVAAPALTSAAPRPPAPKPVPAPKTGFSPANLRTVFPFVSGATKAWTGAATPDAHMESGVNVSVAVVDSGIDTSHADIAGQILAVNVNRNASGPGDGYGHGTHVSAIINGHDTPGNYYGVAPSATVISVKIADDQGVAYESDLLRGLDWVRANRDAYHIGAVNLSVSSGVAASYVDSPVDAAVERLWKDNVAVVAAAGNLGTAEDAVWYAPANDPYAITVGCLDDNQTQTPTDDSLCPISSRGITQDGFSKPDLVAPGRKVVSALSTGINGHGSTLAAEFPDRITPDGAYIRLSGTSMAAPSVTGAIALLLQRHGGLQPNQLRQLLIQTATTYPGQLDQAGALNIAAALVASDHAPPGDHYFPLPVGASAPPNGTTTLLWDGSNWATAMWDGSRWANAAWDGSRWASSEWDGSRWANTQYDGSRWAGSHFDGSRWASDYWDGSRWASTYWDGSRWSGAAWDSDIDFD
ncbi:MAG: S8 family peptidase [Chloroflexi bacterium]|nr:S8 family peptidase [Chloroflexota bacterium]